MTQRAADAFRNLWISVIENITNCLIQSNSDGENKAPIHFSSIN